MFFFKNKLRQDIARKNLLIKDLVFGIGSYHEDYKKLKKAYDELAEKHMKMSLQYCKLMKCVSNYLEVGASPTFELLLKEHAIGEESEVNLNDRI